MRKPMPSRAFAAAALMALLLIPATASAIDFGDANIVVSLDGETHCTGTPLAATAEIELESPDAVLIRITNTSPEHEGACGHDATPILKRVGFNLLDGPPRRCLDIESDEGWRLTRHARPVCGHGRCGHHGSRFTYGLKAPWPVRCNGLHADESVVVRITIDPACQDDYAFTFEGFLDAPQSVSAGQPAQWAAKFKGGGWFGFERGCARGDTEFVEPEELPEFTWGQFVATSAEIEGMPSVFQSDDTRAGSLDINLNGSYGFGGEYTDPAYLSAYVTLRNGASAIVEEAQMNRRWPPHDLDANGCSLSKPYPQCWSWPETGDTELSANLPVYSGGSNTDFDDSGLRVEVAGEFVMDLTDPDPQDSSHETLYVTWTAPQGIDTARLKLRAGFDLDLDGQTDQHVDLMRRLWEADDFTANFVNIVAETATSLTVEVNIQDSYEFYLAELGI